MKTILLLHGAIGAADQLETLQQKLATQYKVLTMNLSGHGGKPYSEKGFSIPVFAEEVKSFIREQNPEQVSIFGYSMGGYVAMYLAKHNPEMVESIVTLATKFHWDEPTAQKETGMLNADVISDKVPAFAKALEGRHAPNDWKGLLDNTKEMLTAMGNNNPLSLDDYATINTNSLLLLGDRDKMVTLKETVDVYKALPKAQLGVLPATPHPIEQVNMDLLSYFIAGFIK
ncbi:MAG: alpha/beta hydrolase [Bacteroidetes bacterium]|nr:alpha/beta hydrolase [Bacteroidota bacterium]